MALQLMKVAFGGLKLSSNYPMTQQAMTLSQGRESKHCCPQPQVYSPNKRQCSEMSFDIELLKCEPCIVTASPYFDTVKVKYEKFPH